MIVTLTDNQFSISYCTENTENKYCVHGGLPIVFFNDADVLRFFGKSKQENKPRMFLCILLKNKNSGQVVSVDLFSTHGHVNSFLTKEVDYEVC